MKRSFLLAFMLLFGMSVAMGQNVGIGVSSPAQKLHVGLNTSTLRLEGLSSTLGGTHIVAPTATTDKLVFVNSSGDFKAMPNGTSGQVLAISAAGVPTWTTAATTDWTLLGNAGTNPTTNFIGTTDNVDWVVRTNNIERLRVSNAGYVGINTAPSATGQLAVSSALTTGYTINSINTTTTGTAILGQITGAAGAGTAIAINGVTNQSGGFGVRGENNQAAGRAVLGINTAASGTTANGAGVYGQINQGASSTLSGGMGVVGVNTHSTGYGIHGIGNNISLFTFVTTGAGSLSSGSVRGGIGVANTAAATGSNAFGLQGLIIANPTGSGYAAAVRGDATATAGAADGVSGVSASSVGMGVYGSASTTSATAHGVFGYHTSGNGNAIVGVGDALTTYTYLTSGAGGVFNSDNVGAAGYVNNLNATGLLGQNTTGASTGTGTGVWGQTGQSQGNGIYGVQTNAVSTSTHFGPAIYGINTAAAGAGYGHGIAGRTGQRNAFGIFGQNLNNESGALGGTGVFGAGNNQGGFYLTAGSGGAFTGRRFGVFGRVGSDSTSTADVAGGYFYSNVNAFAYVGARLGGTIYKISGTGAMATWVRDLNNQWRIMSAPETPEVLLMDYGTGKLVNGFAHIELDPIFSKNIHVDANHPLRVFIQLEGDCNGVYVTNKTATGFDVVELQGGASNVFFSWHVVANRADEYFPDGTLASKYVGNRFKEAPELPVMTGAPNPSEFYVEKELPQSQTENLGPRVKIRNKLEQNIATGKVE